MYVLIALLVAYSLLLVYSSIKIGKDYEEELNKSFVRVRANEKNMIDNENS